MKTLDEVIDIMEHPLYGADDGFAEIAEDDIADALHYLKEYRSDRIQWEADRKNWQDQYAQAVENFKSSTAKHLAALKEIKGINDPLTWDELNQMEGKPVWMEDRIFIDGEERHDNRWALVYKVSDKYARLMDLEAEIRYQKCNYVYDVPGTDHWQVYRKERK